MKLTRRHRRPAARLAWLACALVAALFAGCRTGPPLPPVRLSEPGWTQRQGQALWKSSAVAPEIAGEIIFARHPDGRALLQFSKTPWPLVVVQTSPTAWQAEFIPQKKSYRGPLPAPARLSWLQLVAALAGRSPASPWQFSRDASRWTLRHPRTGEVVEGFLDPP